VSILVEIHLRGLKGMSFMNEKIIRRGYHKNVFTAINEKHNTPRRWYRKFIGFLPGDKK
jgi:hypothetical protein